MKLTRRDAPSTKQSNTPGLSQAISDYNTPHGLLQHTLWTCYEPWLTTTHPACHRLSLTTKHPTGYYNTACGLVMSHSWLQHTLWACYEPWLTITHPVDLSQAISDCNTPCGLVTGYLLQHTPWTCYKSQACLWGWPHGNDHGPTLPHSVNRLAQKAVTQRKAYVFTMCDLVPTRHQVSSGHLALAKYDPAVHERNTYYITSQIL